MSSLRPPTEEDVSEAVRLMNEHKPEPVDDSDVLSDWTSPRVDLASDARIGDEVYVLVEDIGAGRAWIELHGRSVSEAIGWAESRAREQDARRLYTGAWATNAALTAELRELGYTRARSSFRMEVALDSPPPAPERLAGIDIRTMHDGEERAVYDVHQHAFEDVWEPMRRSFEDWSHWFLQAPRFAPDIWLLACAGPKICGVAICHPHPTVPATGWVDVLAVRREWRRRGIGRTLLLHAFHAFGSRGLTRACLGVDSDSPTGANSLYEDVGMRATQRFDIYEKAIA